MDDNLNIARGGNNAPPPALSREAPEQVRRVGVAGGPVRRKLHSYDRVEGRKMRGSLSAVVKKPDRLSDEEYARRSATLDAMFGMVNLPEGDMSRFHDTLYIAYALLGGSQVSPNARASFTVDGVERQWSVVANYWGVDLRRAFRTVADEVVEACRDLYHAYDPDNDEETLLREMMIQLADARDLSRYPWLVADCAEAAYNLDPGERAAISRSKANVIGAGFNAVDKRSLAVPIHSAESYDSTNYESMASVPSGSDRTGGGLTYR